MYQLLLISIVVISCLLIFLVLMQQGKGADAGAAFGSGASGTVFGAKGSGTFLSRMTSMLAALFFVVCLAMAWLISSQTSGNIDEESIMDSVIESGAIQDLPNLPGADTTIQVPAGDVPTDLPSTAAPQTPDLPSASSVSGAVSGGLDAASDSVGSIVNQASEAVEAAVDLPSGISELEVPELNVPALDVPDMGVPDLDTPVAPTLE